jgi:hypothetical protein
MKTSTTASTSGGTGDTGMTELVVARTLLRVAENVKRFRRFLELPDRFVVAPSSGRSQAKNESPP